MTRRVAQLIIDSKMHQFANQLKSAEFNGKITYKENFTYDDQISSMRNYRCGCGDRMKKQDQLFYRRGPKYISEHHMTCYSCDGKEKIQFSTLRSYATSHS